MSLTSEELDADLPSALAPPPRTLPVWPLWLAGAYLLLVAAVAVVSRIRAESSWWSTLLIYLPQVLYLLPAPLVGGVVLWSRDRRALAVFILTLVLITGPLMGGQVPLPSFTPTSAPRVRLLEYNIQSGRDGFDRIRAQVERFRPDVVIFAEARDWGNEGPLRAFLQDQFSGWYTAADGDIYIASRWPIRDAETTPISLYRFNDPSLDRKKVRAVVEAPFGRFQVAGAHFYTAVYGRTLREEWKHVPAYMRHTGSIRRAQAEDVLDWTRRIDDPLILAGDFNTPPAGQIYALLTGRFGDSFAERGFGWGYTFQSYRPLLRIDYIFHTRQWDVVRCEVGRGRGSDHLPVFAELALRQ